MSFLTRENVRQHCRTCLKKSKTENGNLKANFDGAEEVSECKDFWINIVNNVEIQKLINSFIDELCTTKIDERQLLEYPQCICICCYNKLQSFALLGKQIRRSAQKLEAVLYHGVNKVEIGEDDDEENQQTETEVRFNPNTTDILKLLVKDTLMETESVRLDDETKTSEVLQDHDPFSISKLIFTDALSEAESVAMHEESNDQQWKTFSHAESEDDFQKKTIPMVSKDNARLCKKPPSEFVVSQVETGIKSTKKEIGATRHSQGNFHQVNSKTKKTKQLDSKMKRNSFKCEQCGHSFAHKITHDAHIRKVHEGTKRPFQCDRCEKSYSFIGGLYTHIKEIHEAEVRSYVCNHSGCNRIYTSFIAMQKHKRLKHSDTPCVKKYVCEQCGATFNQSGNLKYHRRSKHPTEAEQAEQEHLKERFECDVCKKFFHSRYTLKYHTLQLHTDEMKYECNMCGRRMAKKFMLAQHMLVHSTDKKPCEHCDRQFIRKFELEAHVRAVHMKLKPFECQYCSECFASRKTLRHHEYIHTGEKPYVCDVCGQAYRQQTCLKNHRKSHEKLNINVLTANNRTPKNPFSKTQYSKMASLRNGIIDISAVGITHLT